MTSQNPEISLSQEELIYLLMLMKTTSIPGLEAQPMVNLGKEQTNLLLAAAERSLLARGFIHIENGKTVGIDQVILALVGTCAMPEYSVLVSTSFGRSKQQSQFFHAAQKMAVEHTITRPGLHHFIALKKTMDFLPRIKIFLRLSNQPAAPGSSIQLSPDTFQKAGDMAIQSQSDAIALLQTLGIDHQNAERLAVALAGPVSNSSVVAIEFAKSDHPTPKGMALLEGSKGIWSMQFQSQNGSSIVNLVPTSADEVYDKLSELFVRSG
jgi:hypothetical protein